MDLYVELPDGTTKLVPVSLNCSVRAATQSTVLRAGMASVASKLSEFSLAKNNSSQLVDVAWLDEGLRVKDQLGGESGSLNLILLKKYFSVNTDLSVLSSNAVLLKNIYSQFRRAYVSGLYKCTQSEAVTLSALIARAEFSLSELRPGSLQKTGRLEKILPPCYVDMPDMENNILTTLGSVAKMSESKAQEHFITTIQNSDTFGLSLHSITLVQIGGDWREALLGVGSQHISVMEKPNLYVVMQWKTRDLTAHSFNDTTFTMNYGSETVTVVTRQGHMISAFLSGMSDMLERENKPPAKKPMKHGLSAGNLGNGVGEICDRKSSTHIKGVGKQVKQYEVQHLKSHPAVVPRPFPRGPAARPSPPPRPRHTPLRSTQSVPIQPRTTPRTTPGLPNPRTPNSGLPSSLIEPRGVALRGDSVKGRGVVYEVPIPLLRERREKTDAKLGSPLHRTGEAHYEVSDTNEGQPPQLSTKLRPLPPPLKKQPLKKALQLHAENGEGEKIPVKIIGQPQRKMHKSDSDVPTENGARECPESPIYDELVPAPEYDFPTPLVPRDRNGKGFAAKCKSQVFTSPSTPTHVSNPFSPPPPSSPAPPPPLETMARGPVKIPRTSISHTPAPQTPAPPTPAPRTPAPRTPAPQTPAPQTPAPQTPAPRTPAPRNPAPESPAPQTPAPKPPVYDTISPEDDMREIEDVFGSKDLPMKVKFSCDTNPIYDTLAATKVKTSLNASDATYHSFTLERQRKKTIVPLKPSTQPQAAPAPPLVSSSSSPLHSSPHDYENSELLSLLFKETSPLDRPMENGVTTTAANELQREKPRKKTPSPPPVPVGIEEQPKSSSKSKEPAFKPPRLPVPNTPSYGYSRLEHFPNNKSNSPAQPSADPAKSGATEDKEHEYAEVNHKTPKRTKLGRQKLKSWLMIQDSGSPPPVPPMRGTEAEGKKIGPPKPPRVRVRWEKKVVERGESKNHKALKNNDALRDYSTLLKEFRMFHVKLPTGVVHTELANIKSEVGKLIQTLCALLCMDEEDHTHYSLYVEGTPFTQLAELSEDEDGGEESGMFRRLRQKSPSRLDLFGGSNKSFAVLSERSTNPILLDPSLSFKSQGVTTARILALRPQTTLPHKLTRFQIRVPDWVRFHQCWLSVVQGNLISTQADAIKLAALQYQAYFLDRTEVNSVIGFCRSSDFLPNDCANVKGIEEKVFAEQQRLKGYTRLHAQDSYIFTACSLLTYNTIFFHCLEAKRKLIRIGNTKLVPVLIGTNPEGVVRADFKTKEIMDVWPYQVLKNWGYTEHTFILEFDDRTYPLKTRQGRWMNALVDFHIEAILGNMTTPPATHQEMGEANSQDDVVPIPHNRDNVDEIYSDLLSVRLQAQQWLAEASGNKPSSSPTTSPPHSPPTPLTPSSAHLSPVKSHTTSKCTTNQVPESPGVYEEVDFDPSPQKLGFYDVLRKEYEDDEIYDLPPDS